MSVRITPCFWVDAEAASEAWLAAIPDSAWVAASRKGPEGPVLLAELSLAGRPVAALNGGPMFRPTPALSLTLMLPDAAAVDRVWAALAEGGEVLMELQSYDWSPRYGWLQDRFGVSWQLSVDTGTGAPALVPTLMFTQARAGQAEAAMRHYASVFPDSGVGELHRHDGSGPDAAGTVMHGSFTLGGAGFMAFDSAGLHAFGFTEGTSLIVICEDQAEIDRYWEALSADPGAERCGWLKDRFGVSWQVVPRELPALMADLATAGPVTEALMEMTKIDLAALRRAAQRSFT